MRHFDNNFCRNCSPCTHTHLSVNWLFFSDYFCGIWLQIRGERYTCTKKEGGRSREDETKGSIKLKAKEICLLHQESSIVLKTQWRKRRNSHLKIPFHRAPFRYCSRLWKPTHKCSLHSETTARFSLESVLSIDIWIWFSRMSSKCGLKFPEVLMERSLTRWRRNVTSLSFSSEVTLWSLFLRILINEQYAGHKMTEEMPFIYSFINDLTLNMYMSNYQCCV